MVMKVEIVVVAVVICGDMWWYVVICGDDDGGDGVGGWHCWWMGAQAGKGPQSTAPATHKVLHLQRNLHFKAHKVLHLPRKSAARGPQSAAPGTKSALQGPQSAAPATKFALQGPQSTTPATKSALRGPRSTAPATKSALQCSQSTAPAPATISENEPHLQKSRFIAPVTKLERVEDHHHVQSAAPATKFAFRSKTAPIPCACHEKSTLDHQNTRFPLRLP